jgi:hypothetical protein
MGSYYHDFNMRDTLRHWKVSRALAEILANCLDECKTSCSDILPLVELKDGILTICDKGSGLQIDHFIQNINPDKQNYKYIGKFGFGLKDSIAVLFKKGKHITIESKYFYTNKIVLRSKTGCKEKTIQMKVKVPHNKHFIGTSISIGGISESDFNRMKDYFPQYSNIGLPLIQTECGCIYNKRGPKEEAKIFINGIRVNVEPNFMYHYHIITNNVGIMKCMSKDRDRTNITKSDYAYIIQKILIYARQHNKQVREDLLKQFDLEDEDDRYHELTYEKIKNLEEDLRKTKDKVLKNKKKTESSSEEEKSKKKKGSIKKKKVTTKKKKADSSEEEKPIPPTLTHKLIKAGNNVLKKFDEDELKIEVGSGEKTNVIYIKEKYFDTEKIFYCKLVEGYIQYCQRDSQSKKKLALKLISLLSKVFTELN